MTRSRTQTRVYARMSAAFIRTPHSVRRAGLEAKIAESVDINKGLKETVENAIPESIHSHRLLRLLVARDPALIKDMEKRAEGLVGDKIQIVLERLDRKVERKERRNRPILAAKTIKEVIDSKQEQMKQKEEEKKVADDILRERRNIRHAQRALEDKEKEGDPKVDEEEKEDSEIKSVITPPEITMRLLKKKMAAARRKRYQNLMKHEKRMEDSVKVSPPALALAPTCTPIFVIPPKHLSVFQNLEDSSYQQRVTLREYHQLLQAFFELNASLFLSVQFLKPNSEGLATANEQGFKIVTRQGVVCYHSYHLPHGTSESGRFIPKEYRSRFFRVFQKLGVSSVSGSASSLST